MMERRNMPVSITVSDEIFNRLEKLAIGFDTPERVIERLLDEVDSDSPKSAGARPKLTFTPDETAFKNELLTRKKAQVILHFKDGERDVLHWNAERFQPSSNLRANLWSGFLRGWKEKGIIAAEFSVLPRGSNLPDDDTELRVAIAGEVHWTVEEVDQYFIDVEEVCSDDGFPYYYLATFDEETPAELKKIAGLNSCNQIHLDLNFLPSRDEYEPD
ncbi:hypothetical protein ACEUCS_19370 [Aeromonas caviae]|nr:MULTISPECIES: hypothetical protein [Aeromonas]MCE9944022.1 hypothetical protein [Aeromonas rivipollensis]